MNNKAFDKFAKGKRMNQNQKASKKCFIYTRVSSKDQFDSNTSLTTQKEACEKYAGRKGYCIGGHFGNTYESAKTDDRKEFRRMLKAIDSGQDNIQVIVVYSYDSVESRT